MKMSHRLQEEFGTPFRGFYMKFNQNLLTQSISVLLQEKEVMSTTCQLTRFPLVPLPPQTIQEALPDTKIWWPSWDTRTKLNCFNTGIESCEVMGRIRYLANKFETEPPESIKKYVIKECKDWNLIWVGKDKAVPIECGDIETLLGFPTNHTRGGGSDRSHRNNSLGNSFQVDTVAYHLSLLRDLFPGGINVLSLFSGIGGAEVALHRLKIPMKNVVSVEISEVNRLIIAGGRKQTRKES